MDTVMDTATHVLSRPLDYAGAPLESRARSERQLFATVCATGVVLALTSALLGAVIGFNVVLVVIGLVLLGALLLRWPILGFYIVGIAAVMIDQGPIGGSVNLGQIYVFYWPPSLEGLIERPIGVLVLYVLAVLALRRFATRRPIFEGGKLLVPFLIFILIVAEGLLRGLATGGDLKTAVVAVRPLYYLFVAYILAYNLVTSKKHVVAFLWIVVIGVGLRALLGLYILLVLDHGQVPDGTTLLPHEESFFFVSLLLLVILQILHSRYRPQFSVALALVPVVLIALIKNDRRTDYVALVVGIVVVWALVIAVRPQARRQLVIAGLCCALLGTAYVAAFGHSGSTWAAPAHGFVSAFDPSDNKVNSNLYRDMENYDTQYTAKQSPLIGLGFGKPFLQPEPLTSIYPDIQQVDPYYNYVPHNNIYWILFSLGLLGFFALWYLFGSMIVRGSLIARRLRDPYLRTVAIFIVGAVCMEIVVAYADYQLFLYRNVFFVGLLAGILMRLPALDRATGETGETPEADADHVQPALRTPDATRWNIQAPVGAHGAGRSSEGK